MTSTFILVSEAENSQVYLTKKIYSTLNTRDEKSEVSFLHVRPHKSQTCSCSFIIIEVVKGLTKTLGSRDYVNACKHVGTIGSSISLWFEFLQ